MKQVNPTKQERKIPETGKSSEPKQSIQGQIDKEKAIKQLKSIKPVLPFHRELSPLPQKQQTRPDIERMESMVKIEPIKAQLIKQDMPVRSIEKLDVPQPKHKRSVGEVIKDTATNLKLSGNDFLQRQEESKGG